MLASATLTHVACAGCFWMPQKEDGSTKGYAFVEYSRREVRPHN